MLVPCQLPLLLNSSRSAAILSAANAKLAPEGNLPATRAHISNRHHGKAAPGESLKDYSLLLERKVYAEMQKGALYGA